VQLEKQQCVLQGLLSKDSSFCLHMKSVFSATYQYWNLAARTFFPTCIYLSFCDAEGLLTATEGKEHYNAEKKTH